MKLTLSALVRTGAFAASFASLALLSSCGGDDDDNTPSTITVSSIKAGSSDLNGATAATGVSPAENIVVTFSSAVDAATATAANFNLKDAAGTAVASAVTASGSAVTINPNDDLMTGSTYTLAIGTGVKGSGGATFGGQTVTFSTSGPKSVIPPQVGSQVAYLNFNGNTNAQTGTNPSAAVGITYGTDRGGNANAAAIFDGSTSIVEFADGGAMLGASHTWAFWIMLDSTNTHGHFVMGLDGFEGGHLEFDPTGTNFKHAGSFLRGGSYNKDSLTFFDAWTGESVGERDNTNILANKPSGGYKATLANKWAHVAYSYNASTKIRTIYVNGLPTIKQNLNNATGGLTPVKRSTGAGYKLKADDSNLSNEFAIGFSVSRANSMWDGQPWGNYDLATSNHFKGMMDDFRAFNVALSDAEVQKLYSDEK